jgi:hypothetical protein
MTVILAEVPDRENERRLGTRGWTNKTWEKYYQTQMMGDNSEVKQEEEATTTEVTEEKEEKK